MTTPLLAEKPGCPQCGEPRRHVTDNLTGLVTTTCDGCERRAWRAAATTQYETGAIRHLAGKYGKSEQQLRRYLGIRPPPAPKKLPVPKPPRRCKCGKPLARFQRRCAACIEAAKPTRHCACGKPLAKQRRRCDDCRVAAKPVRLCGCGKPLHGTAHYCDSCRAEAKAAAVRRCVCGVELPRYARHCGDCQPAKPKAAGIGRGRTLGPRHYKSKKCTNCTRPFEPTGPRNIYCTKCKAAA